MEYTANEYRYTRMKYERCGRSGVMLPKVSLGFWHNFGSVDPYERSRDIARYAFDNGITHFDLANNYGPIPGSAEETLGRLMDEDFRPYRDELFISTKAGYEMWQGPYGNWGSRKYMIASLEQSLKRMRLDYVDLFYSHRYDPSTPLEETLQALVDIVRQGKALYVGISRWPLEPLDISNTRDRLSCCRIMIDHLYRHRMRYPVIRFLRRDCFCRLIERNRCHDILRNRCICIPHDRCSGTPVYPHAFSTAVRAGRINIRVIKMTVWAL